jgi:hypothetical protein
MIERSFTLIPFPAPHIPAISLTGNISLQDHILTLNYFVTGNLEEVLLPPISAEPARKDELWKATCFEFFVAVKDQPGYWEFNMSPAGDWNVYRMDAYRRIGFRSETGLTELPFTIKKQANEFSLNVTLGLTPIVLPEQDLQMAITAIIQTKDGNETYWALAHPAPYADFHLRESFILELAGQAHLSEQSAPDG